jgi:flagellar motor switch protein FliN/FliY
MNDRSIAFLQDIPVEVVVELGRTRLTLRKLAALDVDDVVELDRGENDPVDLVVGGRVIARAMLVRSGEQLSLRIVDMGETAERNAG